MKKIISVFLLICVVFVAQADEPKSAAITNWDILKKVKVVEKDNVFVPKFSEDVTNLDGTDIELRGYIMPLEQGKKQKHFILSVLPVAHCSFCLPGGAESMVEVKTKKGIKFGYNPITIKGTLKLLQDDPMGMFYQLTNAIEVIDE